MKRAIDDISILFDAWCERRALGPLSKLLPGWFAVNGLTDGWEILRESLRHTRAMCMQELHANELEIIGKAIAELDVALGPAIDAQTIEAFRTAKADVPKSKQRPKK